MNKCPADNCGRTFESLFVLEQHLKRRHPKYLAKSSVGQQREKGGQEQIMQEEINKLPKIRHLKMQSREHKPVEVYRKSLSKGKPEQKSTLNSSKITSVISDSRTYLESSENQERKGRRPSLNKKNSSSELMTNKQEKLPQLKSVRQKKLEILGGHSSKLSKNSSSFEQKDPMSMTAPNFNKPEPKQVRQVVKSRQKSREKLNVSQYIEEPLKKNNTERMLLMKTQQGFHQDKETKLVHHPRPIIKKLSQRERIVDKTDESIHSGKAIEDNTQKTSENVTGTESKKTLELKKQIKLKHPILKRDGSLRKGQSKPDLPDDINFQQRTVVIKTASLSKLTLPPASKCQFIFANNLSLSSINLNNLQTLRQLSLQHNQLKDLAFLNYASNYNIQKLFVDHNALTVIDFLPPNLKVFSATFNKIEGLEQNSRELSGIRNLQEIDFTFNPIRKEPNYRLHVISSCLGLKKIDGIKITKFDLQLAAEYTRMLDEQLGLIPSNKITNLMISRCSNSPSTVVSLQHNDPEPQQIGMTYEQLQKQISKLSKITKQTQDNLEVIKKQNEIISGEISDLKSKEEQMETEFDSEALYDKLMKECQALQLLNFLQYASEEELEELIAKKERQMIA